MEPAPCSLSQSSCHRGCSSAGPSARPVPSKAGRRGWKQILCPLWTRPVLQIRGLRAGG